MYISYVCFEGTKANVEREKEIVKKIVSRNGGITLGAGPGAVYDQKKFDTPYLRDFLMNYQVFGDVCETGATWSDLNEVHATDRKSTRLNSSHVAISYAVFCLKKKTTHKVHHTT